ncbi:MAG TPA: histidine phosphatase family protein [Acidimicrobiales bacterium]
MLIVVRHGRTEHNATGRLLGRLDPPLDELGRRQAKALADAVGPVDRVISSPLLRTRETAEGFGAEVEIDERWIELDYGELDGAPLGAVPPELWQEWRDDITMRPPGGETLVELGERVWSALDDLATHGTASERTTVVVTHVSPVKAAVAWALGVGQEITWRLWVAPASITRIGTTPHGGILHTFNEIAHLDGVVPPES